MIHCIKLMFPVTWCGPKYKSTEAHSNLLGSPAFLFTSAPLGFQLLVAPFNSTWNFIFLQLKPAPQRFSFLLLALSSSRVVFQPSLCFNSTCSLISAVFELLSGHSRWQELSASNSAIVPTLCPVVILGQRKSSGGCPRWSRCSYPSWTHIFLLCTSTCMYTRASTCI